MNDFNLNLEFDLEKNKSNVIKVIGVGGGGSNAVNYMYQKGIKDVDFVVVNTDSQDLSKSPVPVKIQIGKSLTEGLGAGANPEIGERAAIEDIENIKSVLENNTKMIFITAGMGGGTGTGAAPIIAKLAKEMGILTVGIVTSPFEYEGKKRNVYAQKGIENLRDYVDSLIIINNNKLREIYGDLKYKQAFAKSDEVLAKAATSIAEVITHNYTVNVDFRDVKTVLEDSGTAIMGSAKAAGENRSKEVIMQALDSPLLNDNKITGAKNVLLLILSGNEENEVTIDEMSEINDFIQQQAGNSADIIMGIGEDKSLGEAISVTIIATGFNKNQQDKITNAEPEKIVHVLTDENGSEIKATQASVDNSEEQLEAPIIEPIKKVSEAEPKIVPEYDEHGNIQMTIKYDVEETKPSHEPIIKKPHKTPKVVEEKTVTQPMLFNIEEEKTPDIENEIEDLTELPIEIALKLKAKRKPYLEKYAEQINPSLLDDQVPAFKKKGIDIDLDPKSSKDINRIEMNNQGEFKLKESNSFLEDNVD
ncbi:MAG TPA: cell division protein FtsZ [Flavobacteriales bacterium]|nr:cell division protein FtsZ [Flavobacteriales bacterium]